MSWFDVFIPKASWGLGEWASFAIIVGSICGAVGWLYRRYKTKRGGVMKPILDFEFDNDVVLRSGLKRCFIFITIDKPELIKSATLKQFFIEGGKVKLINSKKLMRLTTEKRSAGWLPGKFKLPVKEMIYYLEWKCINGNRRFSYLHLTKTDNDSWWPQKENDWIRDKKKIYLYKIKWMLNKYLKKND